MSLKSHLLSRQPLLKKRLRIAKIDTPAEDFVLTAFKNALILSFTFAFVVFFIMSKKKPNFFIPILILFISFQLLYKMNIKKVDVLIAKRGKKIDKEVLFLGRFLLVQLSSGKPLINAIEEASRGFGHAADYFKDIMRDIELGTPLEDALTQASEYCPSEYLKRILFQITNALKIGVDVTNFLEAIIGEIAEEQLTAITRYGKKLSSLTMFYMLVAIIVPSLGMTLFIVIASLIDIKMNMISFSVIIFLLFLLQFIFITLFRSARPNMDV